jgi:hypothetical protein
MFGLLRPSQVCTMPRAERLCYQGEYCSLCGSVVSAYGFSSRLLVLYDFASLPWLLVHRESDEQPYSRRNCVKLGYRRGRGTPGPMDRFLAAASVFACGVKFHDDVADEGKRISRIALRYYDAALGHAEEDLIRSGFDLAGLKATLQQQQEVEHRRETGLDAASTPSGSAYAVVARHLVALAGSSISAETAGLVGDATGRCVYLADAFQDYAKDLGVRHNPLQMHGTPIAPTPFARHAELAYYVSSLVLKVDEHLTCHAPPLLLRWGRLRDQLLRLMRLGKETVTLNSHLCIPCGSGYVVADSKECDNACMTCGCIICCASLSVGECCCKH